jgi:rhodanese-related sulfurtransferase
LIPEITPKSLAAWRADAARPAPALIDVRERWEFDHCRIEGSQLVPLGQLVARLGELPRDRPLVIVCHHGNRSGVATDFLRRRGFDDVWNLAGGVEAWASDVDPSMPRY